LINIYIYIFLGIHENPERLKNLTFATNHEDLMIKKLPLIDRDDEHRTILAHHIFHANIKHTIVRFIRETPV
jgi:hypothetical protein